MLNIELISNEHRIKSFIYTRTLLFSLLTLTWLRKTISLHIHVVYYFSTWHLEMLAKVMDLSSFKSFLYLNFLIMKRFSAVVDQTKPIYVFFICHNYYAIIISKYILREFIFGLFLYDRHLNVMPETFNIKRISISILTWKSKINKSKFVWNS